MSAQEISGVRVVSAKSPKVSALRLVTSEDIERLRKELASRRAVEIVPLGEKGVATGAFYRQPSTKPFVSSGLLDLAIRASGFVLAAMVCFVIGMLLMEYSTVDRGESVVVQTGDTLWSVAMSVPEAPSVSSAVEDIKELNGLSSDILNVGQDLVLPRY